MCKTLIHFCELFSTWESPFNIINMILLFWSIRCSKKLFWFKVVCRVRVTYLKEWNQQFFTVFLNKFLKHVFNIILKLNNLTWKKLENYFFVEKMRSSGFIVAQKLQVLEKKKFRGKNFSALFVRIWSSKRCAEIFFLNGSRDI